MATKIVVEGYEYLAYQDCPQNGGGLLLVPTSGGSPAKAIDQDDYRYTHGDGIYQAAVDRCHALGRDPKFVASLPLYS